MLISTLKNILLRILPQSCYKFFLKDWISLLDLPACAQVLETKRFTRNLIPQIIEYPSAKTILVIAPHPDDDLFGAGGTLCNAAQANTNIHTVYITDVGDSEEHNQRIHNEMKEAVSFIGIQQHYLGLQANHISLEDSKNSDALISLFNKIKPDCVFITFLLDDHDDHRRVNELLLKIAKNITYPPKEIWAYQIYSTVIPNVVVDITKLIKQKEHAIRLLKSVKGERDWAHYVLGLNAMNCRFISSRKPVYAESFFVVPWDEYLDLCRIYFSNPPSQIYYHDFYRTHK